MNAMEEEAIASAGLASPKPPELKTCSHTSKAPRNRKCCVLRLSKKRVESGFFKKQEEIQKRRNEYYEKRKVQWGQTKPPKEHEANWEEYKEASEPVVEE